MSAQYTCVASIAEDICTATTRGQWKLHKRLLLGMTVRHLTCSAQLVTLLNRFGHCTAYSQLLELETAMAVQVKLHDAVLPHNISAVGNKLTICCWDNFDVLEETPSGTGTTHTTHGILIQELETGCATTVGETCVPKTRKRSANFSECQLPPCYTKSRVELLLHVPSNVELSTESLSHYL